MRVRSVRGWMRRAVGWIDRPLAAIGSGEYVAIPDARCGVTAEGGVAGIVGERGGVHCVGGFHVFLFLVGVPGDRTPAGGLGFDFLLHIDLRNVGGIKLDVRTILDVRFRVFKHVGNKGGLAVDRSNLNPLLAVFCLPLARKPPTRWARPFWVGLKIFECGGNFGCLGNFHFCNFGWLVLRCVVQLE